ncbi:MAG: hypothetical protein ACLT3Y_05090 [Ruminococcus callidus]
MPFDGRFNFTWIQTKSGGYIKYAKECKVDNPTQYWHLIESWSKRRKDDAQFNKRIQWENLFLMAEVSNAVDYDELNRLKTGYSIIVLMKEK